MKSLVIFLFVAYAAAASYVAVTAGQAKAAQNAHIVYQDDSLQNEADRADEAQMSAADDSLTLAKRVALHAKLAK